MEIRRQILFILYKWGFIHCISYSLCCTSCVLCTVFHTLHIAKVVFYTLYLILSQSVSWKLNDNTDRITIMQLKKHFCIVWFWFWLYATRFCIVWLWLCMVVVVHGCGCMPHAGFKLVRSLPSTATINCSTPHPATHYHTMQSQCNLQNFHCKLLHTVRCNKSTGFQWLG